MKWLASTAVSASGTSASPHLTLSKQSWRFAECRTTALTQLSSSIWRAHCALWASLKKHLHPSRKQKLSFSRQATPQTTSSQVFTTTQVLYIRTWVTLPALQRTLKRHSLTLKKFPITTQKSQQTELTWLSHTTIPATAKELLNISTPQFPCLKIWTAA